ncbi:MAG: electron transfer flavoprotein subunit alpha/FixB family protein [Coriobacteriia bacterium]|nr:electron transfer flavoprotein subunit alpha/FixB family protein [Coriobacteriia bacterium]MCL2749641.1 electron transfer flavoprotein subunit alpha/FixB family protein [Coriobacteriia bacterium]
MSRNVLIFGERGNQIRELITAARLVVEGGSTVAAVVNDSALAEEVSASGIAAVNITSAGLNKADVAAVARALQAVASNKDAAVVIVSADRRGRLVGSYLAQLMNAAFISNTDRVACTDDIICTRNTLGGMLCAEQKSLAANQVIAISAKVYDEAPSSSGGSVEELQDSFEAGGVSLIAESSKDTSVADITEADVLVVVGSGVEKDYLDQVQAIADKLSGLVACTKPVATDRKWYSEELVIGISGKTCKPSLALLFGVSGQVQFYAGIRDAKVIAAIDKDQNALITGLADYVLIADTTDAIPGIGAAL